jgi:acetyl-CoA carboxylase beta subunit
LHSESISFQRNLANAEQARRKASSNFVCCPRCKGYHGELKNNDNLCEKCEQIVHMIEFDKTYATPRI